MEKLPIKFFTARNEDNQKVEGGGNNSDPQWVLQGELLVSHSKKISKDILKVKKIIKEKNKDQSNIPVILIAKIDEEARAKTRRVYIKELLSIKNDDNIIGVDSTYNLMFKIQNVLELDELNNNVLDFEKHKLGLSCINEISLFESLVNYNEDVQDYKVKLINYNSYDMNNNIQHLFEITMTKLNLEFKKTNYMNDLVIYKILNIDSIKLNSLKENDIFNAIYSINPMPYYSISMDELQNNDMLFEEIEYDDEKEYPIVGILDNGIARIPYLEKWIYGDRWSPYPDDLILETHGTFVAGVVVYGDKLENEQWVNHSGVRVFDAAIFPDTSKENVSEDELISNIQRVIELHHKEIKIWNLSISIIKEINDNDFSDFAKALDSIQDKYNVLICKSAGNTSNVLHLKEKERICEGADSIRSVVVGSVAHMKNRYDLVEKDNPSPFSRLGPGPQFIIKPEISHYGGNFGYDDKRKFYQTGVKSFDKNGKISTAIGTSFSTPRVASLIAGLDGELEEAFDPLLLKALVIHNSKYSKNLKVPEKKRTKQMGFGIPGCITDILYNKTNEATLILRDNLSKGEMIDILDFPMPECLIKDGYYTGKVIVTLVYDPILDPTQGAEYCQSNIDVKFGSYDYKKLRDIEKRNILNPVGREGTNNVLKPTLYSKTIKKGNIGDFALMERLQIQYGDKYYPVKKYAVDLSEMTEGNKINCLGKDKKWFLKIQGLYRDFVETQAKLTGEIISQEFCLIITIKGDEDMSVYDNVTQNLDYYNFVHNNIKITNKVNINIED